MEMGAAAPVDRATGLPRIWTPCFEARLVCTTGGDATIAGSWQDCSGLVCKETVRMAVAVGAATSKRRMR